MDEAAVQLLCPECAKHWRSAPRDLPASDAVFHCPNCHASYRLTEFMRTDRDLTTLRQFE
ncbi:MULTISPECIES: hypothetical protein [Halococcus]|uniref:DUF7836 family putative zinc-binding protein n=1 Tax=Halococcus TaxID=2249 RepID=UPI000E743B27|nr:MULTISPECIES: hypothetical protein [Halococcus]RJT06456.1 hypothetical protein D3261_05175 [Halococcus sp. IIIV-5B]